ncbi:ion channel [Lysinibacillus capsici]|uniref:ion channel n=1 Tax=Lysinibacillus capsici TaxID=2115968 RepID=UPI00369C8342
MYYIEDKERKKVIELTENTKHENIYLINERPDDGFDKSNLTINQSTFSQMGFKKSQFKNSNLSHNIFMDCYFKDARMEQVSLVGSKFINCTFDNITLISCDFRYATFENCYIDFKDMLPNLPNLPSFHNVRWKMCTNLALECLKAGNSENYKLYFYEEKKASEKHYWEMFRKKESYYRRKYGAWDSLVGLFKYTASKFNKLFWGYGENIWQLVAMMLVTISVFTLFLYKTNFYENGNKVSQKLELGESLYISVCNFFTIGSGYTTTDTYSRILTACEGFVGMIIMGFFIAALFRFINRR